MVPMRLLEALPSFLTSVFKNCHIYWLVLYWVISCLPDWYQTPVPTQHCPAAGPRGIDKLSKRSEISSYPIVYKNRKYKDYVYAMEDVSIGVLEKIKNI